MTVCILQSLQQRRTAHRDGHHANQHLRVVRSLLVGLAVLLALLPLIFTLTSQGILIVQLAFPDVHSMFADRLT